MKVTVCFGPMRILVPCGSGEILVRDLITEAVKRYKKAAGKEPDSWVAVRHLQTQSGILDPDDYLRDVADDREHILASFEDSGPDPGVQQGGGDGASGSSSVGTGSPDIFRDPSQTDPSNPHIEVTSTTSCGPMNGLGLQVRRSSDPNLLQSLKNQSLESNKRWSAAAPVCSEGSNNLLDKVGYLSPQWEEDDDQQHSPQPPQTFARSGRLSMQFLGDGNGYKWMEAAEKFQTQAYSSKSLPREAGKRKEPLGQEYESMREKDEEVVLTIMESGGPLGLTAHTERQYGLLVQKVDPGSRAEQGQLRKGDRIVEINGTMLKGLSEKDIKDYLRSIASNELRILVKRSARIPGRYQAGMIEADHITSAAGSKIATVSPTRKPQVAYVGTSLQDGNTRKLGRKIEVVLKRGSNGFGFSVASRDNPAGGHCPVYIKNIYQGGAAIKDGNLKPGDRLLEVDGIPVTQFKSHTDVVNMLKTKPLDAMVKIIVSRQEELVEGNEREINFLDGQELKMKNLEVTPQKPPPPVLPPSRLSETKFQVQSKNLNESQHFIDAGNESAASSDSDREVLILDIPVHDTEKAGLGIKVKGKVTKKTTEDLGIYVETVISGGAASRDGRLRKNDQLLSINGVSLLGKTNANAMAILTHTITHTTGNRPGVITLKISRSLSSNSSIDHSQESSTASENSGATVIYLSPEKKEMNRWSNPVLERLTGGVCPSNSNSRRPSPLTSQNNALRNESYYMATDDTWSPTPNKPICSRRNNTSVLIEDDSEPMSPTLPHRSNPNDSVSTITSHQSLHDATYSSQLSLDTNISAELFTRDAIGRRSMSEKHHAALDAKETGTYQRTKKLREDRERERRLQLTKSAYISGSMESITTRITNANKQFNGEQNQVVMDLQAEARDLVGELGPKLGLKKSSSLESLQTMVQEIQMSDEPRGPKSSIAPRGRIREDSLRAAVVSEHDGSKPRKTWLLEDADAEGGFSNRNGPFQSSLNEGKNKSRAKKPSILRGIGHMFRFGKHRKDGVAPMDVTNSNIADYATVGPKSTLKPSHSQPAKLTPPIYQPPPLPPSSSSPNSSNGIHHGDVFNQRYQHYANYDELQTQISRRHQHYHSQRSARSQDMSAQHHNTTHVPNHINGRPISSYYEYETVQHNVSGTANLVRKLSTIPDVGNSKPTPPQAWKSATLNGFSQGSLGGSGRSRGPYVTQVHIPSPSATSNGVYQQNQILHQSQQAHASNV